MLPIQTLQLSVATTIIIIIIIMIFKNAVLPLQLEAGYSAQKSINKINNNNKYLIFHTVLTSYTSSKVGGGGSSPNENILDSCGRGGIAGACLGMGGGGQPGGLVVSLETET